MKSRIRRAVRLVDIHALTRLSASLLSGRWSRLVTAAKSDGSLAGALAKLWPLVEYCYRLAIEPEDICDATVATLRDDLEARGRKDPFAVARDVVYAWERLQSHIDGWPPNPLTRLYRPGGKRLRAMEFADLPPTLLVEWQAFVAQHGRIDDVAYLSLVDCVVDEDYEALLGAESPVAGTFSPASISNLRTALVDLANASLAKGVMPTSLSVITVLEVVKAAVAAFFKRREVATGQKIPLKSATATQIVSRAIALARFGGAPSPTIAALSDLRDKVDPRLICRRSDGTPQYHNHRIGERHRKRLAAFNDPARMWAWFELPHDLAARMEAIARAGGPTTLEEIGDGIVAVLYAITLCAPLRRRNLAQLTIAGPDANLWLPPTGKGPGKLRVPSPQVKNRHSVLGSINATSMPSRSHSTGCPRSSRRRIPWSSLPAR